MTYRRSGPITPVDQCTQLPPFQQQNHPCLTATRLGVQPLGNAEPLWIDAAGHRAVGRSRRRRRQIGQNDAGPLRRQSAAAREQLVVVLDEVSRRAQGVEPAPVVGRRRRTQPVPRGDPRNDRAAATAVPEHLGGAVVRRPQHDVERRAVVGGELGLSPGFLQQQVVRDEQLDDRGDRHCLVVAVGDDLPGVAVKDGGRDVGAGLRGFGRGLPGPGVEAGEGGGRLVGRGFRQWRLACPSGR